MNMEHVHEINQEVRSIAGGYIWEREGILELDGREALYVVGNAFVDSSCCGIGGCRFAYVPGYVRGLRIRRNEQGLWVSEVEPIHDDQTRDRIRRLLEDREIIQQVQFGE